MTPTRSPEMPEVKIKLNVATEEGRELGENMARLCDTEMEGKKDNRCETCAFKRGNHLANGSPETLMTALKCAMEGEVFWCHEHEKPCAGWQAMKFPKGQRVEAPWSFIQGFDDADLAGERKDG